MRWRKDERREASHLEQRAEHGRVGADALAEVVELAHDLDVLVLDDAAQLLDRVEHLRLHRLQVLTPLLVRALHRLAPLGVCGRRALLGTRQRARRPLELLVLGGDLLLEQCNLPSVAGALRLRELALRLLPGCEHRRLMGLQPYLLRCLGLLILHMLRLDGRHRRLLLRFERDALPLQLGDACLDGDAKMLRSYIAAVMQKRLSAPMYLVQRGQLGSLALVALLRLRMGNRCGE